MPTLTLDRTVGQIVADSPRTSIVFERYGIDYCCAGKIPFEEACARRGLDAAVVASEIVALRSHADVTEVNWTQRPLSELIDHIIAGHHDYLRENLPRIDQLVERVVRAHGERDPRLGALRDAFGTFCKDIDSHMAKEEQILFPLVRAIGHGKPAADNHCGSVANPIGVMEAEHDAAGDLLLQMRELTDGYVAPKTACNTYRALLDALEQLESNMHVHIHKENSILFPRAIAAEKSGDTRW